MRFRQRQFRVLVPAPAKHSMSFGERLRCFGRANIGPAQSFWCDYERVSPKVFAPGEAVPTVNRLLRMTVGLVQPRRNELPEWAISALIRGGFAFP